MSATQRLLAGIIIAATITCVAVPVAAVIYVYASLTGCEYPPNKLEAFRESVEADIAKLHIGPVEMVAICDSGDRPYLETTLASGIVIDKAIDHLQYKGWRVVRANRTELHFGKVFQKRYRVNVINMYIEHQNGSIQISL